MEFDNEPQIEDFSHEMFDKDIDNNLLTKISSTESTPFIQDNTDSGSLSKFDSATFSKSNPSGTSVSDIRGGRSLEGDEFHDATSEREVAAISPESPVDNMSQAVPTTDTSRLPRSSAPSNLGSPRTNQSFSTDSQRHHNGIDNENSIEDKELNMERKYSEQEVQDMLASAKQADLKQWSSARRKLEGTIESKTAEMELLKSGMGEPDNSLELVLSAHNMAFTELLIKHHKPGEETLLRQVKKLSEDNSKILKEMDVSHSAMSDLHKRYDKAREVINQMKQTEDVLEERIRTFQQELTKSEENCRNISSACDLHLETANSKMEHVRAECDKDKVMMGASIKRLELESKSWQAKFLDKEVSERELFAICDSLMAVKEQEANEEQ